MAFRIERVEKIIEREIASILFDSNNQKLKFVSVTKVAEPKGYVKEWDIAGNKVVIGVEKA